MEIIQINPPEPVIVRAFGDEPVALFAYRIDNKAHIVYVGSQTAIRPIGLPIDQVYGFDGQTFAAMGEAYSRGNKRKLAELYGCCNRYRNMPYSPHDQERLTDSRCAAEGDGQ
jgi:hypothetical protein